MQYCTNCGNEIKVGISFCTNCGTKIRQAGTRNFQSVREDYFKGMRERLGSDSQELVQGDVQIVAGPYMFDVTVGFFRAPKKNWGQSIYALVCMGNANSISKHIMETFYKASIEADCGFLADWQVPDDYSFLKKGRLTPGGLVGLPPHPICDRIALLASADVDDGAKGWVVNQKFKTHGDAGARIAGILDTSRPAIYFNAAPRLYSFHYDLLGKYIKPAGL